MDEKYSLSNLRDIVPPDAPPIWPLAVEAWLLLAILVSLACIVIYQRRLAGKKDAYRKIGLAMLDTVSTAHDVSVVLKRVALAAYPREQVASLYGEAWTAFLQQTGEQADYSPIAQAISDKPASQESIRLARDWIRHHRVVQSFTAVGEN